MGQSIKLDPTTQRFVIADNVALTTKQIYVAGDSIPSTSTSVANLAALRAIPAASRVDGMALSTTSPPLPWVFSLNSGAGFLDDGATVILPNDVLVGNNGRWFTASPVPVVPTYAALLLAGSGQQSSVVMQAYSSLGDNGGGTWHWNAASTATANVGTIVQPTGVVTGRWLRDTDGSLNVKWFGARGDNATDDAPALNAMFLWALNTAKGYYVFFPRGIYRIQSTVMVRQNNSTNFWIEGEAGTNAIATNCTAFDWQGAAGGTVVDCPGAYGFQLSNIDINMRSNAKIGVWLRPDRVSEGGALPEQGSTNIQLRHINIYNPQNVAGGACVAAGPPNYGNGLTQCDTVTFHDCNFWGQPSDINEQAVGFINLVGNNTKIFRFFECGFLFLKNALDLTLSSGPVTLFGCQMGHMREAIFHASDAVVTCNDTNMEGNAALLVGSNGGGNGLFLFINCEGNFGNAENITGLNSNTFIPYMVDYRGGRCRFIGGRYFNYIYPVITAATAASPIVITTPTVHGLTTDDRITIAGAAGAGGAGAAMNGPWVVTVLTSTTFSIATLAGIVSNGAGMTYTASSGHFTVETRMRIVSAQALGAYTPTGFSSECVTWGGAVGGTVPVYGNDNVRISEPSQARSTFNLTKPTPYESRNDISQTDNVFTLMPEQRSDVPQYLSLPKGTLAIGTDGAMTSSRAVAGRSIQVDAITAITGTITAAGGTPTAVTSVGHGRSTGDVVLITGAVGSGGINGEWTIVVSDANIFTLTGSRYFGNYSAGGQWTLIRPGTPINGMVRVSVTPTFGSIGAGAVGTATVTVVGAGSATGDLALAQPTIALQAGLVVLDARVTATDTVTLSILNTTAGALTPTAGAWNVKVEKF